MNENTKGKNRFLHVFIFAILFTILYMMPVFGQKAEAGTVGVTGVKVYTFDVGSGSCAIVEFELNTGDYSYIMVDAGSGYKTSNSEYTDTLNDIQDFITQKNIKTFKYVILSHYDSDHMKMLDALVGSKDIKVGQFVCKTYTATELAALEKASQMEEDDLTLTEVAGNYEKVQAVIEKKKSQGTLQNAEVISPTIDDEPLSVGTYVQENGKYTAVKVSLRFMNTDSSHFTGLYKVVNGKVNITNEHMYDWRAASNNDSLVFVMRYYDPAYYGNNDHVTKILFCGDILSGKMAELVGKSYDYIGDPDNKGDGEVISTSQSTPLSDMFQKYASGCDLVAGWPHHGKILGTELKENNKKTVFTKDWATSQTIRDDFSKLVSKSGNETVCFVSTETKETIKQKADDWNSGNWSKEKGIEGFDIPSLVKFKAGGYYTNCITGGHALLSKFDVIKNTQTVYACKSTATKYIERLINTTDKTYYDLNYTFNTSE